MLGRALVMVGAVLLAGCDRGTSSGRADAPVPSETRAALAAGRAIAPSAASPADDGQWTMPAKDYANTRFSELTQIDKNNVSRLQVALTFSSGTTSGQESAVLAVGGTLYLVTPYPNTLYAIDMTKP